MWVSSEFKVKIEKHAEMFSHGVQQKMQNQKEGKQQQFKFCALSMKDQSMERAGRHTESQS